MFNFEVIGIDREYGQTKVLGHVRANNLDEAKRLAIGHWGKRVRSVKVRREGMDSRMLRWEVFGVEPGKYQRIRLGYVQGMTIKEAFDNARFQWGWKVKKVRVVD